MKNRSITQLAALGVVLILWAVYLGPGAGPAAADTPPVSSRTPDSLDFGSQQVGTTSAPRTITVTAVSDGFGLICDPTQRPPCWEVDVSTRISNLTIGGTDAAAFSVSSQNCTGRFLWQGQTCSINVTYSPAASGNHSATLNINSNSSWSTGNQVQLSGHSPAPPNDAFASAQTLGSAGASVNGTTAGATREPGEPDHYTSNPHDDWVWVGEHTVWYSWKAPDSGSTTIDTCQANIDSILAVYTGAELSNLNKVADNNDFCGGGWGSKVTFDAQGGTTYRIAVGDARGLEQNTFTLNVSGPTAQPPRVTSTDPVDNGTRIDPGANISATFSEKMDPASITKSTFKLFKLTSSGTTQITNVSVSPSTDGLKATLDPFGSSTTRLSKGAKYKAVVTTGAKDLAGNRLDQNSITTDGLQQKAWTFTIRS
jgi:hypothetical protein